ncbi:ComF family protein [Bacillota bacterium LX-D]|nr:ComF family protein [Bacillota bacterium LX-D]
MQLLKKLWAELLAFFYPPSDTCPLCLEKITNNLICENCQEILQNWQKQKFCNVFGRPKKFGQLCRCTKQQTFYRKLHGVAPYQGVFKKAVYRLKYSGQTYLAVPMGSLMGDRLREIQGYAGSIIIPIPLSPRKRAIRGFNQAELLARAVAERTKLPVYTNLLTKIRDTAPQAGLKKVDRLTNLQGAFNVPNPEPLKNKVVILVDDIFTTGSTINEAAQTLLKAGAKDVYALVWAIA